jgi:hypothetical protein
MSSAYEFDDKMEGFSFGDIGNWASNQWAAVKRPDSWQRNAVRLADRAILAGAPSIGKLIGGDTGATIGEGVQKIGNAIIPDSWREGEFEDELEGEWEFEGEGEFEDEGEGEISPVSKVYPDAMMEHLGFAAMEAESEDEAAEGFLPLIPMVASKLLPLAARAAPRIAAKILPKVARAVSRVTPHLTRSVGQLARTLHHNPRTRPLLNLVPGIARRTVANVARHAMAGRHVSPHHAVRLLARQNHRVLSNPQVVNRGIRRAHWMDRRYHRMTGTPHNHPHAGQAHFGYRGRGWAPGQPQYWGGVGRPGRFQAYGVGGPGGGAARVGGCRHCGSTVVHRGSGSGCAVVVVR